MALLPDALPEDVLVHVLLIGLWSLARLCLTVMGQLSSTPSCMGL